MATNKSVRYIRNLRPNMFKIKLYAKTANQIVFPLERRGHPEDCLAVPAEAFNDNGFLANIRRGYVEEIDQKTFQALASRVEAEPIHSRLVERTPHGVASAFDPEVFVEIGETTYSEDGEPFYNPVNVYEFEKELMSPRLEFETISDSVQDAENALKQAGIEAEEPKKKAPARKKIKQPERHAGPPRAQKYEDVNRKNTPRKKTTKGVVGGETIEAMEAGE